MWILIKLYKLTRTQLWYNFHEWDVKLGWAESNFLADLMTTRAPAWLSASPLGTLIARWCQEYKADLNYRFATAFCSELKPARKPVAWLLDHKGWLADGKTDAASAHSSTCRSGFNLSKGIVLGLIPTSSLYESSPHPRTLKEHSFGGFRVPSVTRT